MSDERMRRACIVMASLAWLACSSESPTPAPAPAPEPAPTPAPAPAPTRDSPPLALPAPLDAAAVPPDPPACAGVPTIVPMATQGAPLDAFLQVGARTGERLLTTRNAEGTLSLAVYVPATDTWSAGPSLSLADGDPLSLVYAFDDEHLVVLDEASHPTDPAQRFRVHALALAGAPATWTWSTPAGELPISPMAPMLMLEGDALIAVPQACGHREWASSRVLSLTDASTRSLAAAQLPARWRPVEQVRVGRRLVVWAGTRALAEIDAGSDCELAREPVRATAILDLPSGAWQLVEGGPPGSDDSISLALDDELVLGVDQGERTGFWSLALGPAAAAWSELPLDAVDLFPASAGFSSLTSLQVGRRGLFVRASETGSAAVVRDAQGVRVLPPGPAMITLAVTLALDERRVLIVPRGKLHPRPSAYLLDVEQGAWCSLQWPLPARYWTARGSSYFRFADTIGERVLLWGPDASIDGEGQPSSGLIVRMPGA